VGNEFVQVGRDGAYVLGYAPFIVIQDGNEAAGGMRDVVEGLEGDAVGEGGVTEYADDMLVAAAQVSGGRDNERGREGSARVASSVTVVLTLGAEANPLRPLVVRMVPNRSFRPVRSLWT